jgi:ATP-dependent helicase/nuclease subunit A
MLFRTFNHVEVYRQALIRYGIPHRVLRGRGFYGAQEVLDLASLLSLLADPDDTLAFAAVLRSPLVGLSDASLFRLAGPEGLSLRAVEQGGASMWEPLPDGERERLARFLSALPSLRRERDRLGVRALLLATLELTGFREALAATPYAEQASANVEKLLALAGRRDERGAGGCVTFARELQRLVHEEPTEAQADLLEAGDPRAVQLLTIHRAKGLEWPVVVVPSLGGARRTQGGGRVLFERGQGLGLRPWLPAELLDRVDTKFRSPRFDAVREEIKRRETAEYRRLLYVALTRAQDRLLLSGGEERNASDSWWCLLDARLQEDPVLRGLVEDLEAKTLPEPPEEELTGDVDEAEQEARVESAWQRARGLRAPVIPESVTVEIGALQDFIACPHCYHQVHHLGLRAEGLPGASPPRPSSLYVERDAWGSAASDLPERLLELVRRVDFRLATAPASERRARLEALARDGGWELAEEGMTRALSTLERLLDTAFARELAVLPGARLHRSLSFVLALPGGASTSLEGELDLLWETPEGEARGVVFLPGQRPSRGLAAYTDFLAALELAARELVREGPSVRVGLVFLGEESLEPDFSLGETDLQEAATRLRVAARALAEAEVRGRLPGHEASGRGGPACGHAGAVHSGGEDAPSR